VARTIDRRGSPPEGAPGSAADRMAPEPPQIQSEPTPPYPAERLEKPGLERDMRLKPRWEAVRYRPAGKLTGKVALITGGDSGIGKAVAILYAREGADVAIVYLPAEEADAAEVARAVEREGRRCLRLPGDLTDPAFCHAVVEQTVRELGRLDVLVSNAAYQESREDLAEITDEQWSRTFRTNMDAYFYLSRAAVRHLGPGAAIIATSSETAQLGQPSLLDYSATKGAIDAFTRSLAKQLAGRGIRVNAVAAGPVWTPLNPADQGKEPERIREFGTKQPLGRAAQPEELAPAYVFLASDADSSYVSGIVLEVMGGL